MFQAKRLIRAGAAFIILHLGGALSAQADTCYRMVAIGTEQRCGPGGGQVCSDEPRVRCEDTLVRRHECSGNPQVCQWVPVQNCTTRIERVCRPADSSGCAMVPVYERIPYECGPGGEGSGGGQGSGGQGAGGASTGEGEGRLETIEHKQPVSRYWYGFGQSMDHEEFKPALDLKLVVNGDPVSGAPLYRYHHRNAVETRVILYAPIRLIADRLGAKTTLTSRGSPTIAISKNDETLLKMELVYSWIQFELRGEPWRTTFGHAEFDGRVYLPIHLIADVFEGEIAYDAAKKVVRFSAR